MPKIMQNLVFLMEPSKMQHLISLKGANMCLNRFCIDEDASFELSGVYNLKKPSSIKVTDKISKAILRRRKTKGKVNYTLSDLSLNSDIPSKILFDKL